MITVEQAKALKHGDILHFGRCVTQVGPRGGKRFLVEQWRVSGRVKLWKTRPEEFRVPLKYGLYNSIHLTQRNAFGFHLASECQPEVRVA